MDQDNLRVCSHNCGNAQKFLVRSVSIHCYKTDFTPTDFWSVLPSSPAFPQPSQMDFWILKRKVAFRLISEKKSHLVHFWEVLALDFSNIRRAILALMSCELIGRELANVCVDLASEEVEELRKESRSVDWRDDGVSDSDHSLGSKLGSWSRRSSEVVFDRAMIVWMCRSLRARMSRA